MTRHGLPGLAALLVGLAAVTGRGTGAAPQTVDPAKLDTGARIYGSLCTTCHGPDGDAIPAVNLKTGQYKRELTDLDLMTVISKGVPGTAMPANNLSNNELFALIAYLHVMKDYGARRVVLGDAGRGRAIFEGKAQCLSCHRVNQQGAYLGPDLTTAGASFSAAMFQDTLLDPSSTAKPGNRTIRAVTKTGEVVTGRRLNEDTWSVQIMDSRERLVSLWKPDLKEYAILGSPMPSYKDSLSAEERSDLIAYLVTLTPPPAAQGRGRGAAR
ncbi:MAG: c-type cytochrome [Acidobacteria bacterium]|nr:c-type cytochrome [Acidobacteriota bacterium]